MKNQLKLVLGCLFILLFGQKILAQDCPFPTHYNTLNGNNIRAVINNNGNLFNNKIDGNHFNQFELVTNTSIFPYPSTLYTTGIWIAAKDSSNNLRLAAAQYQEDIRRDFSAGPILNINGQISIPCENYDRTWEVFGDEINQHRVDFADNGIIDFPLQNIYAYPAHQNPHFEGIHGFTLPNTPQGLAPFFDQNNNDIYNPDEGDFPLPEGVSPNNIPMQIIWSVFNDAGSNHTSSNGEKLNFEIQQTAWAFYCHNNELLNNSIFTSHKIINRGNETLDSLYFSTFVDFDIGCFNDDHIGCIPDQNTFYAYNLDSVDGSGSTGTCTTFNNTQLPSFVGNPPVQAITFLNQNMSSFCVGVSTFSNFPPQLYPPNLPSEYFNYMKGKWSDGSPLTFGGDGYNGSESVSYLYPDNPNDPNGWSMVSPFPVRDNSPTYANCYLGNQFHPNDFVKIDMAYTTYKDPTLNHQETVNLVYNYTPTLQQLYDNEFENCETMVNCTEDCVWTGDANRDSMVTGFDILQIGLNFGTTGTVRNTPLLWQPFESQNWGSTFFNIDLKHSDCNGNAIIDFPDFHETTVHFGKSYNNTPPINIFREGEELTIKMIDNSDTIQVNQHKTIQIRTNQEEDIAGLTFTVESDVNILDFHQGQSFTLWNTSLLDPQDSYQFDFTDEEKDEFHCSFVKTDGENSLSQNQLIASFSISVKDTSYQLIQTYLRIKNIKALLIDGTDLDYGSQDFLLSVVNPNGTGILLKNENLQNNAVQIFPNPTTSLLNIIFEKHSSYNFSIFDYTGKRMLKKKINNKKELQLSISNFPKGIYFLSIKTGNNTIIKKFIKL